MENDGDEISSIEQFVPANAKGNKIKRHHPLQIHRLEAYFKENPHPDKFQQLRLSQELNLTRNQVKFWFQNRRTHCKNKEGKSTNVLLRGENERLRNENEAILDALRNLVCPTCGPPFVIIERQRNFQELRLENARLREQLDQISSYVSKHISKRPMDPLGAGPSNVYGASSSQHIQPPILSEMELSQTLSQTAAMAIEELKQLFLTEEQFWVKSTIDGTDVIDQDRYQKYLPAIKHFRGSSSRVESSKYDTVVPIEATSLIQMFFDAEKWKEYFPTIVNEAKMMCVLGPELPMRENCNVLQVMWEQLHILSPLVPPREFMIVRCCQEIGRGLWIIADVSYNFSFDFVKAGCYKRPSGCLIQALPNSQSKVIWIEHVEMDDKWNTHQMFREVVGGESGYGAKRWIVTLERMCQRMALTSMLVIPETDWSEEVPTVEGRWSVLKLGERMVKNFKEMLIMFGKIEFPKQSNSRLRVSIRENTQIDQPLGLVISATNSFLIPLTPLQVFDFLLNNNYARQQWDIIFSGAEISQIARIGTGSSATNCVTILRPTRREYNDMLQAQGSDKDDMLVLQDSYMDALGGMLVYAPLNASSVNQAVSGEVNPATIPILSSGFVINSDGRRATMEDGGAILTIGFQILVSDKTKMSREVSEKSVNTVTALISSTVQRIKALLNVE